MARLTDIRTLLGCAGQALLAIAVIVVGAPGCTGIERTPAPPRSSRIDSSMMTQVPQVMRGTVASETVIEGYQPVPVHGLGLVVGLNGTGSSDVPPDVRSTILATAARHGIGSERVGLGELSPEALLDSPDTAVVVVRGVIPPAAPEGTTFDVTVSAFPTSSTISLEGGRLYTADLTPRNLGNGFAVLPPTGSRQPAAIALARGPLVVNPFAEPGSVNRDEIDRRNATIQAGGVVSRDMPLKLRLTTPSHTRAMVLQNSIKTRFPQEAGQREETAHGESDELIDITVPLSYHDRTEEFIALLQHMSIRQAGVEQMAMTIRRHVIDNPADASAAAWRWQAMGPRVIPIIRDLYDHADERPRLAALQAGARLDDALVVPHLIDLAETATLTARQKSIELLGGMAVNPAIDIALRDLLDDSTIEIRLAAYEALLERRDPYIERFTVDGKFIVDVVPAERRLVYVTQSGMPRVALFGHGVALRRPVTVTAWSQRFMIKGDMTDDLVEVYYRPVDAPRGTIHRVEPDLPMFLEFLGHTTTVEAPREGLGLSYSEVIGVLHQIWRQGYLDADFMPETDRVMAALLRQPPMRTATDRPEFTGQEDAVEGQEAGGMPAADEEPDAQEEDSPNPALAPES